LLRSSICKCRSRAPKDDAGTLIILGGKPIAAGSPWQNGYAERLIGTIRRECVDHLIVFGELHLRGILRAALTIMISSFMKVLLV
jgi:Integrase core domain